MRYENIAEGDLLEVDVERGVVRNMTKNMTIRAQPLPPIMMQILSDGGLAEHFKKHGEFTSE